MPRIYFKAVILTLFIFSAQFAVAADFFSVSGFSTQISSINSFSIRDSGGVAPTKQSTKICACQILVLQSSHLRQKNFALFAERTKRKNLSADLLISYKTIQREKRHMQAFFYNKLEVMNTVADVTDCRSLYKKLKLQHKQLYLYDILDADIKK